MAIPKQKIITLIILPVPPRRIAGNWSGPRCPQSLQDKSPPPRNGVDPPLFSVTSVNLSLGPCPCKKKVIKFFPKAFIVYKPYCWNFLTTIILYFYNSVNLCDKFNIYTRNEFEYLVVLTNWKTFSLIHVNLNHNSIQFIFTHTANVTVHKVHVYKYLQM